MQPATEEKARRYTTKQMGDAGEMLVAAELTLAGVPALRVPDIWPGYAVIAQPTQPAAPQRIQVKTRTFAKSGNFVPYADKDDFDWLAIVILPGSGCEQRRVFIVPREIANRRSYPAPQRAGRGFYVHKLIKHPQQEREGLADFENNFSLCTSVRDVEVVPGSWLAGARLKRALAETLQWISPVS